MSASLIVLIMGYTDTTMLEGTELLNLASLDAERKPYVNSNQIKLKLQKDCYRTQQRGFCNQRQTFASLLVLRMCTQLPYAYHALPSVCVYTVIVCMCIH